MPDKYYVIETAFGYLIYVDDTILQTCRLLHERRVKRFKSIKTAKAFIESSNSKYLTKQYGLKIIPVFRTTKGKNNDR